MSTRSSNSWPNAIAGAGLRIVVAPAARARLKKADDRRQRNFELADGDVAFGEHGRGDVLGVTSALAPGTTTMVLSALAR